MAIIVNTTIDNHAREILKHQRTSLEDLRLAFLDELAVASIGSACFLEGAGQEGLGMAGSMFPHYYAEEWRDLAYTQAYPWLHRIELLVEGNLKTNLEIGIHFLRIGWFRPEKLIDSEGKQLEKYRKNATQADIDGEIYNPHYKAPYDQDVISLDVELSKIINKTLTMKQTVKGKDVIHSQDIQNKKKLIIVEETRDVDIVVELVAKEQTSIREGLYKVTITIMNLSVFHGRQRVRTESYLRTLLGVYSLIHSDSGLLLDPNVERDGITLSPINVLETLSSIQKNTLFASPLMIHDEKRVEALRMETRLDSLVTDTESILSEMSLIPTNSKKSLNEDQKYKILAVFRAIRDSNPRVDHLYLYQWHAIQKFLNNIITDQYNPLTLLAPTATGKSLVFYTCSALMNLLRPNMNGTGAFVTFPTRALNSDQFSEMIGFFNALKKNGCPLTLGLYMGRGGDEKHAFRPGDMWPPKVNDGDDIPTLEYCPVCGNNNICPKCGKEKESLHGSNVSVCPNCGPPKFIATKPDDKRVVPTCYHCGEKFDFIYLTPMETEHYTPNVVVGTPDKIIHSLTRNLWSYPLFGAPMKKCPHCGRANLKMRREIEGSRSCYICKGEIPSSIPDTKSTPCLVVTDEIQAMSGTQGNLMSQFLSLLRVFAKIFDTPDYMYLGATATIGNREELLSNLTGQDKLEFFPDPKEASYVNYFAEKDEIRHRYLTLQPTGRPTRTMSQFMNLGVYKYLEESRARLDSEIELQGYRTQVTYVVRKTDGHDVEAFLPEFADGMQLRTPNLVYGHGDLSSSEIISLNTSVRRMEPDILIVTRIYAQGVNFPNLNVIHFLSIPFSFIEMVQVTGRTGRAGMPALVLIETLPHNPRDEWVRINFRAMIKDLAKGELFEPTPINAMNTYAIMLSIYNVFNALVLTRIANRTLKQTDCRSLIQYLTEPNDTELKNLLDQLLRVYLWKEVDSETRNQVVRRILEISGELLDLFRAQSGTNIQQVLEDRDLLISSLYDTKQSSVKFHMMKHYPFTERAFLNSEGGSP